MDEDEFYWDRIKHEENLFTSRANFFLVVESMLFATVAVLIDKRADFHVTVLCSVGLAISVAWIAVTQLQWTGVWEPAKKELEKLKDASKLAKAYANMGAKRRVRSADVIGGWLPGLFVVIWIIVIFVPVAIKGGERAPLPVQNQGNAP